MSEWSSTSEKGKGRTVFQNATVRDVDPLTLVGDDYSDATVSAICMSVQKQERKEGEQAVIWVIVNE